MGWLSKAWKIGKELSGVNFILKKLEDWLIPDQKVDPIMVERQGTNHAISVTYGVDFIPGVKVFKQVTDASGGVENEYLHMIVVFSHGEIEAFDELFFNDISQHDDKFKKGDNAKWYHIEYFTGAADQPHCATLSAACPEWTPAHKLAGIAYAYIRLEIDADRQIFNSEPSIKVKIRGKKVFDPRSGLIEYSDNPALCLYDYLTNPVYGKGINPNRIDTDLIASGADFYDQNFTSTVTITDCKYDKATGAYACTPPTAYQVTNRLLKFNCTVDTNRSVFDNTREMLNGMRAWLPLNAGKIRLIVETSGDPVFHIGEDIQLSEIDSESERKSERYNRVTVKFRNKDKKFEADEVVYPEFENPLYQQWLDEDNGIVLETSLSPKSIVNKNEALMLAELVAKRSRQGMICTVKVTPQALVLEPGDIVSMDDTLRGWQAKPFRVMGVNADDSLNITLSLREHQNAVYPWSGTDYSDIIADTWLGDPANIPAPTGLAFSFDPEQLKSGTISWNMDSSAGASGYEVRITRVDTNAVVIGEQIKSRSYAVPVLDVGAYTFQVRAFNTLGFQSDWALITFNLVKPVQPTEITFNTANFEIEAIPVLAGTGLGTAFEFAIGSTEQVRGRGTSIVFTGLSHSTEYEVFARTVNAFGKSPWISRLATTTANAAQIVELIGEDIGQAVLPDVIAAVNENMQEAISQQLADVPNENEVQALIDNSIALVNAADAEDPRVQVLEDIFSVIGEKEAKAEIKQTKFAVAQESQVRAQQVQELNAANQARLAEIQQVSTDLAGNADALNAVQAKVDNPDTGLQASFTLAQQAKTTADGAAQSLTTLTNAVNDPNTGLSATTTLAQQAKTTADGAAQSLTTLTNAVNDPNTGLSATTNLAQQAKTTAEGNAQAFTGLQSQVTGIDDDLADVVLGLQATVDELGNVSGRAYLGVTTVTAGKAVINGLVIEGASNTIEFRTDKIRFADTAGVAQLYWDLTRGKYVYNGDLVGANFQTSLIGYRAEMGQGSFPFWYGTGTKSLANALFAVDDNGNVTLNNAKVQGKLVTAAGSGARVEIGGGDGYLIWAGTGTKNDVNGIFWIKEDTTGFIKGSFYQGEILETKMGSVSNGASIPATATTPNHNSAGKPVEVEGKVSVYFKVTGNTASQITQLTLALKRGTTTLTTVPFTATGFFEAEDGKTLYNGFANTSYVDNLATAGNRTYSAVVSRTGGATPSSDVMVNLTVKTFENKLAS